jgi:hypothetical protein
MPAQLQPHDFISSNYPTADMIGINGESYVAYSKHTHQWDEGVTLSEWVACTSDGVVRYTCSDCGLVNEEIEAAHAITEHIVVQKTCLTDGSAYSECSVCGLRTDYTLSARGAHVYGDWYTIESATGTTDGISRRDCTECGQYETAEFATKATGKAGPSVSWVLTESGHLWIYGEGWMEEYTSENQVPWYSHANAIVSAQIGENVLNIPGHAFRNCEKLTNVEIAETVTSIGTWAFSNCKSLEMVRLPNTLTELGEGAFRYSKALKSIAIPAGVTTIPADTFDNCTALTEVALPDTVTTISQHAFSECNSLERIELSENNPYFRVVDGILYDRALTKLILCLPSVQGNLVIPDGVTTISDYAFSRCVGLNSVVVPESVTSLGTYTFINCTKLETVTLS